MYKYDFFVAGRWRNRDEVKKTLDVIRASGKSAYCFIENLYEEERISFSMNGDIDSVMQQLESLEQGDPFIQKIFNIDIQAERDAEAFLLVLPAGISGHVEAGAAYGMGKKCYALGKLEKTETLYCIFDEIFPELASLEEWLRN